MIMTKHQLMESVVRKVVGADMANAVMEAYEVCFESGNGGGKNYDDLRKMAIRLLSEANAFNVMHWNIDTSSKHALLNEVYELCRDVGDKMAETYMSITEKSCMPGKDDQVCMPGCDEKDALSRMKALQSDMQNIVKNNNGFSEGIKNLFADFDETITGIIYKYQQFKS